VGWKKEGVKKNALRLQRNKLRRRKHIVNRGRKVEAEKNGVKMAVSLMPRKRRMKKSTTSYPSEDEAIEGGRLKGKKGKPRAKKSSVNS